MGRSAPLLSHSVMGSAAVARMILTLKQRETWRTAVDSYIALSAFARDIFIRAGFPIRSNRVEAELRGGRRQAVQQRARGSSFRWSPKSEKGVDRALAALSRVNVPFRIVGDGPEREHLQR